MCSNSSKLVRRRDQSLVTYWQPWGRTGPCVKSRRQADDSQGRSHSQAGKLRYTPPGVGGRDRKRNKNERISADFMASISNKTMNSSERGGRKIRGKREE
ncbi:hypothetical protein PoB_004997300 [Plakobranchus ocellatus]|uniref:Uncharacterized protein n=1 Tax=Plakobranchus ocellatus TaxID=259542 RepID=A0AAV4BV56_9GAST|nr:hypothetical protein PoB_004997300 [Plakobranchus ocellatus]